MSELSNDVKEFLQRMAQEAPSPSRIPPRLPRRVRRRRVATIAASMTAIAVAAYGSTVAVRALRRTSERIPAASPGCSWRVEDTPMLSQENGTSRLLSVAAPSPTDRWMVGDLVEEVEGGFQMAIAIHEWATGGSFEGIPDTNDIDSLTGVDGTSPTDVWAVGFSGNEGVALRWDGEEAWSRVSLERPGVPYWRLNDVVALSPDDVWGVGGQVSGGYGMPLVERWDGERWTIAPAPQVPLPPFQDPDYISTLEAVSATGPDDVWAVGESTPVAPVERSTELLAHWEGQRWIIEPAFVPELRDRSVHLFGVEAVSPTDVWAVGISGSDPGFGGGGDRALVLHRDAEGWALSELPPLPDDSRLFGVAARSPVEVYAVGSSGVSGSYEPLVLRWDGIGWAQEALPVGGASLSDVTVDPAGTAWTVGHRKNGASLVMRCGAAA